MSQVNTKTKTKGKGKKKKKQTVGEKVLKEAMTQKGKPYAWGGGNCKGPSHDIPPHDYGEVGYDCSGLVTYALCQVTGRDLIADGLRVTSAMYCAPENKLKYKYVFPYSSLSAAAHESDGKTEC